MDRVKLPAAGALALFLVAWFLPVEADASTLSDGVLPGWQALMVALGPVTQHAFAELDLITIRELLMAMSALSNVMMAYAAVLALAWPRWRFWHPHRLSWHLGAAFLVNAQWMWPRGGAFLDLRAGYYLWSASFALMALAVRRLERRHAARAAPDGVAPAAPAAPA
ncbi:MAG: hypothetical protein K1X31_10025 [Gemmatimonadaceae bacterium]|nr:hypothetical protein [Gemmatimonadaceae bacterium]